MVQMKSQIPEAISRELDNVLAHSSLWTKTFLAKRGIPDALEQLPYSLNLAKCDSIFLK